MATAKNKLSHHDRAVEFMDAIDTMDDPEKWLEANFSDVERETKGTNIQWGLRRARKQRLRIVEPKPNELQIDIDGAAELAFYRQQMKVLRKNLKAAEAWTETITESKTPGKFHVTITVPHATLIPILGAAHRVLDILRISFQSVLGSDLRRECFNLCRVLNGTKYPIVFFEVDK